MSKPLKIVIWIVVVILVVWGAYSLSTQKQVAEGEPIKIGAILPLSGKLTSYGDSSRWGIELAVEEINSAGGVNNRKISVIYEDSQGDPLVGVSALNKLINQDRINVVLGPVMSSVALSVAPIAESNEVLVMTIASSPNITDAGDFIFRNREKTDQQSKVLARFVLENPGAENIAALYMNDETGNSHFSTFKEEIRGLGGEVFIAESYNPDVNDFRTNLTKLKAANPEVIYLASKPKDVGLILKQSTELGLTAQFVGTSGSEGKEVINIAGKAAEGLVYSVPAGNPGELEVAEFNEKFNSQHPEGYTELGALFYDSVFIIAKVMEQCPNPLNTTCLKEQLYNMNSYRGASGETSFDENGDATKTIILKTIKNGKFVPYQE